MIVVDMTVIAPLMLRRSTFSSAARVSRKDPVWIALRDWWLVLIDQLVKHVRARGTGMQDAHTLLLAAEVLVRESHESIPDLNILTLATETGLSAVEPVHVLTARRLGSAMVTDNVNMLTACPDVAVSLQAFGAK